jgi:hypothetical protein
VPAYLPADAPNAAKDGCNDERTAGGPSLIGCGSPGKAMGNVLSAMLCNPNDFAARLFPETATRVYTASHAQMPSIDSCAKRPEPAAVGISTSQANAIIGPRSYAIGFLLNIAANEAIYVHPTASSIRFAFHRRSAEFGLAGVSTGDKERRGSITKVGASALRRIIVQMVWRMILFQPQYKSVQK